MREKFSETEDVGVASRNAFELGIQQPANDVVGAVAIAREKKKEKVGGFAERLDAFVEIKIFALRNVCGNTFSPMRKGISKYFLSPHSELRRNAKTRNEVFPF